jgi:beta-lactamase regulating signal transducer with metallopeptidase domain
MTFAESIAWSALVVSAVAVAVWIIGALVKRLGVALGVAPAWAVLASIPILTAASFVPAISLRVAEPVMRETKSIPTDSSPLFLPTDSLVPENRTLLSDEELSKPIRPDEPKIASSRSTPTWTWDAVRERLEPAFRTSAPWLAAALLLGLAVGWLRLFLGWRAVHQLSRNSKPIMDAELHDLFEILRAELSCSKRVELKESDSLPSPAAVGWRRCVVLLPTEWRQWTAEERRAVLAHELAHVQRGDYGAWIVAQACAAAHYFNPLVRSVSHWLRMEQECSADADAARLAGGRSQYLRALANLAVRQRDVSAGWPARCFLPTRGSFVRRIEMLRSDPPRWSIRTAAGNIVLTLCVVAAGLALSAFRPALASATPNAEVVADDGSIPVPQTAIAAGQIRVAELLKNPQVGPAAKKLLDGLERVAKSSKIKLEDIDRVGMIVLATDQTPGFDGVAVFKAKSDWDKAKLFAGLPGVRAESEAGINVFRDSNGVVAILLDDKTLAIPESPRIGEKALRAMTGPRHANLQKLMDQGSASVISFATSGSEFFGAMIGKPNQGAEMIANVAKPMVDGQQSMLFRIDLAADVKASIDAEYSNAENAKTAAKTAEAAMTLLTNVIGAAETRVPAKGAEGTLIKLAKSALAGTKVQTEGERVTVKAQLPSADLVGPIAAALGQMQSAATRMTSANNLKQIALAMHIYADRNKTFPPAAKPEGDSKFPVSWRVRILPFIEHDALYREYHMDEPWDGPNNRKLLDKMPVIYRNPAKPSENETTYQVLTGDNTIFPADRGIGMMDITDGTSRTILVVEADKSVPWTKPEDLSYPFTDPLPFGNIHMGGFNLALADGAVNFVSNNIDRKVLFALGTRNGGEMSEGAPANVRPTPPPSRR